MARCLFPCGSGDSPETQVNVISSTLSAPARRKPMPYRIAGIDVHKKKLAVVVADVEVEDEYQFERRCYASNPEQLRVLSECLIQQPTEEVETESTTRY